MKSTNWKDVAEMVGIASIVASLVFVGLEMRQDHIVARSQLAAGTFENLAALRQEMTGPEFAATYAKMLEQPEQLTTAEQITGQRIS